MSCCSARKELKPKMSKPTLIGIQFKLPHNKSIPLLELNDVSQSKLLQRFRLRLP